jgi:hypothetical protein
MTSPYVAEAARRANTLSRMFFAPVVTAEMVRAAQASFPARYGYGLTDQHMRAAIAAAIQAGEKK